MNYFITGGTGFIGTHLTNLLHEVHPEAKIYNLDIIEPGTPLPTVKNYKPALRKGEEHAATFIYCDVRQTIELEKVNITPEDVIFNFAAVHRTPGHPDPAYFETNIRGAENVCAFAERHGIRKIVFTSSIAPYGAAEELKEETTLPAIFFTLFHVNSVSLLSFIILGQQNTIIMRCYHYYNNFFNISQRH